MRKLLEFRAGVGSQVLVYDRSNLGSFEYTKESYERGNASKNGRIAFFTLGEDVLADVLVWEGRPEKIGAFEKFSDGYLSLATGELCIHDPEEPLVAICIAAGEYYVAFAQKWKKTTSFIEICIFLDMEKVCSLAGA